MAMAHHLVLGSTHPSISTSEFAATSKYLMEGGFTSSSVECPLPPPSSSGATAWNATADMHFLSSDAVPMKAVSLQQQAAAYGSDVLHGSSDWQQFVDLGYPSSTIATLPPSSGATEARRSISPYVPSSSPTQGIDKGAPNAWGTLTVDPSKGGLALQGVGPQCFAEFPADPGFAERAARYSSFHNGGGGGYSNQSPNKLSRSSSFKGESQTGAAQESGFNSPGKEDSLNSAQNSVDPGNKKRKNASDRDAAAQARKDAKNGESDEAAKPTKRQKGSDAKEKDEAKAKTDKSSSENSGSSSPKSAKENQKPPEAPKQDYIHVRARRGQATDSHSLAERVRREKISERMKFLQDLVPGCSKVTGKAVMLDEIINYVQSLQRQVEFLSMKLAAVNPRLDLNLDGLLAKEALHGRSSPSPIVLSHDMSANYSHIQQQLQHAQQQLSSCGLELRSLDKPAVVTSEAFADAASQLSSVWDGELQSVVQMFGLPTPPQGRLAGQELQGPHLPAGHMKVEM